MGEHIAAGLFRVVDLSVQRTGGTDVCFLRHPDDHKAKLEKFFAETGNDYSRFNYLGEWHSHPSFEVAPSEADLRTMQSIVEDPEVGVNFLILLICKRGAGGAIEATATAFQALNEPLAVPLALEVETGTQTATLGQRFLRFFGF
jgi:hypothetical protein